MDTNYDFIPASNDYDVIYLERARVSLPEFAYGGIRSRIRKSAMKVFLRWMSSALEAFFD